MKNWSSRTALVAALLLLAVTPLVAQSYPASNDGWSTPGGGQTKVDLSHFPVARVLGSAPVNNITSLKGVPLSSSLGSIDTLLERSAFTVAGGSGSASLKIVALSLTSESNVVLQNGDSYRLDVALSPTASGSGSISLNQGTNPDGGTFSSKFDILPLLTFTSGTKQVKIDCGSGGCDPFTLTSDNTGWVIARSGGFDPNTAGVTPIGAGITVPGGYKTIGHQGAIYTGFTASPPYAACTISEQDLWNLHFGQTPQDCLHSGTVGSAARSKLVAIGACKAVIADPKQPQQQQPQQ
ncbi:MAG TPA: hypothetical protein VFE33_01950 [Thermoanaerobaculia bacterium]|nr:hypothetical protein [Thermoanaerobaculia bacterium]